MFENCGINPSTQMKVNNQQRSCELTPGLYFAFKISHTPTGFVCCVCWPETEGAV
jgi:hypothetical protein